MAHTSHNNRKQPAGPAKATRPTKLPLALVRAGAEALPGPEVTLGRAAAIAAVIATGREEKSRVSDKTNLLKAVPAPLAHVSILVALLAGGRCRGLPSPVLTPASP
jgi:hypothetical protein